MIRSPILSRIYLGLFLLGQAGCASVELEMPPTPHATFAQIQERIAQIRGTPPPQGLALNTMGTEVIQAFFETSFLDQGEGAAAAGLYRGLGLLPASGELSGSLASLRFFLEGAFLDAKGKKVNLPADLDLAEFNLPLPSRPTVNHGETVSQWILSHTLAHAIQEEIFHWSHAVRRAASGDLKSALRAVSEGDATFTALTYFFDDPKKNPKEWSTAVNRMARLAEEIRHKLPYVPPLFREQAVFETVRGTEFILWAYTLKGWEGVNHLFLDPPASSEQILHPEKYFENRDMPHRVIPWSLLRDKNSSELFEETLGEFTIRFLLSQAVSEEEAIKAAAGWAGDTALAWKEGSRWRIAWITAWDSEGDAEEFFAGFRTRLERHYNISLSPLLGDALTLIAPAHGGQAIFLQRKGSKVVLFQGVPGSQAVEMASALWDDLEIKEEPSSIRFELVRP